MNSVYGSGPSRWDPTAEIYPGGPHPAAIHVHLQELHMREAQAAEEEAQRQRTAFLLLASEGSMVAVDGNVSDG